MKPLYTVYVLMDPIEPNFVRYVGVTSQALKKRLRDMMSACTKSYTVAFQTPSGEWLRSVVERGDVPLCRSHCEGTDKQEANNVYCSIINENLSTQKLLNATPGKRTAVRTTPVHDKGPSGKSTNPDSKHAADSLRRKTRKQ